MGRLGYLRNRQFAVPVPALRELQAQSINVISMEKEEKSHIYCSLSASLTTPSH